MILALDTSTPTCRVYIVSDKVTKEYEWEIGRGLADGILGYLRERLQENNCDWSQISAIAAYKGPGSFTGLRIGLTVLNTIADTMDIPIIGETGEDWLERSLKRIELGESDELVRPLYGREPNITKPRK